MFYSGNNKNLKDPLSTYYLQGSPFQQINSAVAFPIDNCEEVNEFNKNLHNYNSPTFTKNLTSVKQIKSNVDSLCNNFNNYEKLIQEKSPKYFGNFKQSQDASKPLTVTNNNIRVQPSMQNNQNDFYKNGSKICFNNANNSTFFLPMQPAPLHRVIETKATLPNIVSLNNYCTEPLAVGCLIPQNVRPPSNATTVGVGPAYLPRELTGSPFFHPPPNSLLSPVNPLMAQFVCGLPTNLFGLPNYFIPKENSSAVKFQTTVVENKCRDELNAIAAELDNHISKVEKTNPNYITNLSSIENEVMEKSLDTDSKAKNQQELIYNNKLAQKIHSSTSSELFLNNESCSVNFDTLSELNSTGKNSSFVNFSSRQSSIGDLNADNSGNSLYSENISQYKTNESQVKNPPKLSVATNIRTTSNTRITGMKNPVTPLSSTQQKMRIKEDLIKTSFKNKKNEIIYNHPTASTSTIKNKDNNNSLFTEHQLTKAKNLNAALKSLLPPKPKTRQGTSLKFLNRQISIKSSKQHTNLNYNPGARNSLKMNEKKLENFVGLSGDERKISTGTISTLIKSEDTKNVFKAPKKLTANRKSSFSAREFVVQAGKPYCAYFGQKNDETDMKLQEWHNSHNSRINWKKINKGLYFFGATEVHIDVINDKLMCSIRDGSWNKGKMASLKKFVTHFEPIERKRMQKYAANNILSKSYSKSTFMH